MTDAEIAKHLSLMKAIPRETVHLPIATVERLMSQGHKIRVGKGSVKGGKFKPADTAPANVKAGRKPKADRNEAGYRANAAKARKA